LRYTPNRKFLLKEKDADNNNAFLATLQLLSEMG